MLPKFTIVKAKSPSFSLVCGEDIKPEMKLSQLYLNRKKDKGKNIGIKSNIVRKLSSIEVTDRLKGESEATVVFSELSLQEAEDTNFKRGSTWAIYVGWWNFMAFFRDEDIPLIIGIVKEVLYSYGEAGIEVQIKILPTIKLDENIKGSIFDGTEKNMKKALEAIAKYCGLALSYNVTYPKVLEWDAKQSEIDKPWMMVQTTQQNGVIKPITPREILNKLAKSFGLTWNVRGIGTLYFGDWQNFNEPNTVKELACKKHFKYRKNHANMVPGQIFTHTMEDCFSSFELIENTTQGTINYTNAYVNPEEKTLKQENNKVADKDYLIATNKNVVEDVSAGDIDKTTKVNDIVSEANKQAALNFKNSSQNKIDTVASETNPTLVQNNSNSQEQANAQNNGQLQKETYRVYGGKISGAELDYGFRSGDYFYFEGIIEHTAYYLAEEVVYSLKSGGISDMTITGTKGKSLIDDNPLTKKTQSETVKNIVEKKKLKESSMQQKIFFEQDSKYYEDDKKKQLYHKKLVDK